MKGIPMPPIVARQRPPTWLLVLITLSGTLAMHMFVPALPNAARELGASAAAMQMTVSLYIVGLAFGQLLYGPLADALGRRPALMAGLVLYTVASLAVGFATEVHFLVAARLVQALGGCAGLVLGRAIVRDTSGPDQAVRELALLNLMMMMGPGLAPLVGGALSGAWGWRAIFLLLAALGALTCLLSWRLLPETGQPSGRIRAGAFRRDYLALLGAPTFVGFALGGGCATTSFYAVIAAAPFIFTTELQRPLSEVGIYLGFLMLGMALGNIVTSRLVRAVGIERLLVRGNAVSAVSAALLLLMVVLHHLALGPLIGLMFLFMVGAGMSSPAALTKAISVDAALVGSASGLYGFIQMAVGALCTALVGVARTPALGAAAVLVAAAVLGQCAFRFALNRERLQLAAQR
jgi:DHA1 family bicyclomycin/chloramphenicol resistance-like MFS transporter